MSETPPPVGMLDALAPTPRQHSPFELALVDFITRVGPPDPAVVARVMDPDARAAYARDEAAQRQRDWPFLGLYRGQNAEARAAASPRVVFMGDSITELWTYGDPDLFTGGIVGRGVSGQTSPQMLCRFYADAISLKPQAIHILSGANDIAGNTGPTTPQDYKNNICAMLDIAQYNSIKVMIGSILPAGGMSWQPTLKPAARIAELNAWLREIAAQRGVRFVDYHPAMVAQDGSSMRPDFANDGVHPNATGYKAMRPLIDAALAELFA